MKGLIFKDILSLRKNMRSIFVMLILYAVFAMMMHSVDFISYMTVLFFTMLSVTSFAYDEQARWNAYAASLPVPRKKIVLAKYIFAVLLALAGSLVSCLALVAAPLLGDGRTFPEQLITIGALFMVSLLFAGVMLPLTYKFGVEKSRLMIIAVFALPTLAVYLLSSAGVQAPDENTIENVLYFSPLAVTAFYYLSYIISCRVFVKKEL